MGPALGYNCRDLVMTIVVTQGHIVCICLITWTFFFFFSFYPSSWLFRRSRFPQILDLSLSLNIPLFPAEMPPFDLQPFIRHRDPVCFPHVLLSPSCLYSQQPTLASPVGMSSVSRFLLTLTVHTLIRSGAASLCAQEDPESEDSEFVLLWLWSKCHLWIQSKSFSYTFMKYAFSV